MNNKILITGAKGQLGEEIRKKAVKFPEFDYIYTDFDELNIVDKQAVINFVDKNQPAAIINCAAYTAVDKAESDIEKTKEINVTGVQNLVSAAEKSGIFLLHISTDFVFDGLSSTPYTETDKPNPVGIYAKTKFEGEQLITKSKIDSAIVRTSWLYSEHHSNFLNTMIRLDTEKQSINVVFDQIGTPTAACDLAKVLLLMLRKKIIEKDTSIKGIFHFSNEGVCSWYDFALTIMKSAHLKCKVFPVRTSEYPTPAKRPAYSVLDKAKIKKTLGIEIPHWSESLNVIIQKLFNFNSAYTIQVKTSVGEIVF